MKIEDKIIQNVSTNIAKLRKHHNYTQLELAEKIGYSDKSISKWERGEALPDLIVLVKLANLFDVSLNDLILDDSIKLKKKLNKKRKALITILSFGLTWLIATIVYVLLELIIPNSYSWLSFIYAIPISMIVLVVFTALWWRHIYLFISVSLLYWSIALSLFISIPNDKIWLVFILAIPLQILTLIIFMYQERKIKKKIK